MQPVVKVEETVKSKKSSSFSNFEVSKEQEANREKFVFLLHFIQFNHNFCTFIIFKQNLIFSLLQIQIEKQKSTIAQKSHNNREGVGE